MAAQEFEIDSFASALKKGERSDCAGLVLVVGQSWGSDTSTMYEAMASDMRQVDPTSLHVYDAQYLHCTVATLSSFKNAQSILYNASPDDRDRVITAWIQALKRSFERIQAPQPFELAFQSIKSSPAATYVDADDHSNSMAALRAAVKEAADDSQLAALSAEMESKYSHRTDLVSLKDAVHVPGIVHSTIMRHAGLPSDPQGLAGKLAKVTRNWKPVTVQIREVVLVLEKHPYMHVSWTEGTVHTIPLEQRTA